MKDVMKAFEGFYCEINFNQELDNVISDISRIMRLRLKSRAPRRPPRVIIAGPPGAGKTTLGTQIAKKYGLIFVSSSQLLNQEISCKTTKGQNAVQLIKEGEIVPDEIIGKLVEDRLNQSDCRINGWVLEGFPRTESQIRILKQSKLTPSLLIGLQLDDETIFERHEYKKIDPVTGEVYNVKDSNLKLEPEILKRLTIRDCDKPETVKERLKSWKSFVPRLEDAYRERRITLAADKPVEVILEAICESIENPL